MAKQRYRERLQKSICKKKLTLDAVTAAEDNMQSKLSKEAIQSQGQWPNKNTGKDFKSQYV